MRNFTDAELAELADWAEKNERETVDPDLKKAYGAIRQGSDWLLRYRIKARQHELEQSGSSKPTLVKPQ